MKNCLMINFVFKKKAKLFYSRVEPRNNAPNDNANLDIIRSWHGPPNIS